MTTIAGAGCSLLDYLHTDVDFSSPAFQALRSRRPGDGGLVPGALVFAEDFEAFAAQGLSEALAPLTKSREPEACNIGGPGIVSLIHAAQVLGCRAEGGGTSPFSVSFTGAMGDDPAAGRLMAMIGHHGVDTSTYRTKRGRTPFTLVLSDPRHDGGRGERSFVNEIGAAAALGPEDLPENFFGASIVAFGGTALTPALHDSLDSLLSRAKASGAFTFVNTVYDFRNESRAPDARWPLGSSGASYASIDLLVTDLEEARRLSGTGDAAAALAFFRDRGVGAAVVTAGTREILAASWKGGPVRPRDLKAFPVSAAILAELADPSLPRGDTTGCGDNFAGGLLASVAMQLENGDKAIDLDEALAWGVASGGLACFRVGGVWEESRPGEKRSRLEPYVEAWRHQVGLA